MSGTHRLDSQFWRRYCQMFSTEFSSRDRDSNRMMVIFLGTFSLPVVCHPARSIISTTWAPFATARLISSSHSKNILVYVKINPDTVQLEGGFTLDFALRHQFIATGFRNKYFRVRRIALDFLPQAVDMGFQCMRRNAGFISPNLTQQHIALDHLFPGAI